MTANVAPPSVSASQQFPTTPLLGPFTSLAAYCASITADQGRTVHCHAEPTFTGTQQLATPEAPFDEAWLFVVESLDPHCQLGIRIEGSWWVLPDAIRCLGERAKSDLETTVNAIEVIDGALVLRASYEQSDEAYASSELWQRWRFDTERLCGVGTKPHCTREIIVRGSREQHRGDAPPRVTTLRVSITRGKDTIVVAGDTAEYPRYFAAPLAAGKYQLVY